VITKKKKNKNKKPGEEKTQADKKDTKSEQEDVKGEIKKEDQPAEVDGTDNWEDLANDPNKVMKAVQQKLNMEGQLNETERKKSTEQPKKPEPQTTQAKEILNGEPIYEDDDKKILKRSHL
jgi:hypothetical protein